MSLSATTKTLLEQAKVDAPSTAAREAMWTGIQTQAAASTVAAAKGFGILSSKLMAGLALGASVAVGVAATVLVLAHTSAAGSDASAARARDEAKVAREIAPAEDMPRLPAVIQGHVVAATPAVDPKDDITIETAKPATTTATPTPATKAAAPALSEQDRLAREARIVSEARGALRRGEPEAALALVRSERHKHGARLVPEELNVEIQALRAMGDEVDARSAEAELAGKYPEQALAH